MRNRITENYKLKTKNLQLGLKPITHYVFLLFCFIALTVSLPKDAFAFTLPDTGQTKCYDTAGTEISCSGTGQDGAYSINPMSYTDNGNGTITDNVTGLMWQKEDDNTTRNWADAGTYCGSLTLGGHSDWRLPSKKELITIVDYSIPYPGPTINTTYFPNTYVSLYWSSTTYASWTLFYTYYAWYVYFDSGLVSSYYDKSINYYVRCVRGGQSSPSFKDNGNGTVTDNGTGLMWQKEDDNITRTWADAGTYCGSLTLGGQSDWRLPNCKELESITDDTKYNPAIDKTYFPNTHAFNYWSSTTSASLANNAWHAWVVGMDDGSVYGYGKTYSGYVRCVRGGQSGAFCNLAISPSSQTFTSAGGSGSVTVTASASSCAWTASSNVGWITISPLSGTGSGSVNYTVAANTSTTARTGTLTIAGNTYTITQTGVSCTYTVTGVITSYTPSGGSGTANVAASSNSCSWTASSNVGWITISPLSGTGSGSVNYTVAANTITTARTGTLTIAGSTYTITQAGATTGGTGTDPLDNWHERNTPQGQCFNGITYANNTFVAVGYGAIATSPDGVAWTARTSVATHSLFGITYGNNTFVAVGDFGIILTSPDGITWTSRTSGTNNSLRDIAYGNNTFVAVGYGSTGNTILTSPDGITWTARTSDAINGFYGITYANNTFIAVLNGGEILTSPDGVTWTTRTSGTGGYLNGITYGNNTFVAVGGRGTYTTYYGKIVTSLDGITWTEQASGTGYSLMDIVYGNNTFVAVGSDAGIILTSPDGVTWTTRTPGLPNYGLSGITYGNNTFVAVNGCGNILQSDPVSIGTNCAASVSPSLVVHIPIVTFSGSNYWADLQYNSGDSTLTVSSAGIVSDVSPYSNCTASSLSSDFKLHIPVLMLNNISYWIDLQYNGNAFVITGYGQN